MQFFISVLLAGFLVFGSHVEAEPASVAWLGPDGASVEDAGGHVVLRVDLSQAVPWRIRMMDDPARLLVEFSLLEWDRMPDVRSGSVAAVNAGRYSPDWSRLVAVLREPLAVDTADMQVSEDGAAELTIRLFPTTAEDFRASVEPYADPIANSAPIPQRSDRLRVAIDPGHGGLDPGAVVDGMREADLMLRFARELKEKLLRSGRFEVVLTREDDVFVPLETRMTLARAAGADLFLSFHADALEPEAGSASGMTVYTLADEVADEAAIRLAERHAQHDILAGVNLSGAEDEVGIVLMEMARRESMPRSRALADTLIGRVREAGYAVNSNPHRDGAFSVLKAAEWPSVLIELGFLSSDRDRERLDDEEWRDGITNAIRDAVLQWSEVDTLLGHGVRQ